MLSSREPLLELGDLLILLYQASLELALDVLKVSLFILEPFNLKP